MKQKAIYTVTAFSLLFFSITSHSATTYGIGVATGTQNITWQKNKSAEVSFTPLILNFSASSRQFYGLVDFQLSFSNSSDKSWDVFDSGLTPSSSQAANDFNKVNYIFGYRVNSNFSMFAGYHHEGVSGNYNDSSNFVHKVNFKNDGLIYGGTINFPFHVGKVPAGFLFSASFGSLNSEFQVENGGTYSGNDKYNNVGAKLTFIITENLALDLGYSSTSSEASFDSITVFGVPYGTTMNLDVSGYILQGTYIF